MAFPQTPFLHSSNAISKTKREKSPHPPKQIWRQIWISPTLPLYDQHSSESSRISCPLDIFRRSEGPFIFTWTILGCQHFCLTASSCPSRNNTPKRAKAILFQAGLWCGNVSPHKAEVSIFTPWKKPLLIAIYRLHPGTPHFSSLHTSLIQFSETVFSEMRKKLNCAVDFNPMQNRTNSLSFNL